MSNGIADYLMEFRLDKGSNKAPSRPVESIVAPHEEEFKTADLIRNAEARVREEERLAWERRLEVALATERASAEEKLRLERNKWASDEANKLSAGIAEGLSDLNRELNERIARILLPFLDVAIREQVLDELVQTLRVLFSNNGGIKMTIAGSEDLIQALQKRIALNDRDVHYVSLQESEIRVVADETTIETQLKMWIDRVVDAVKSN
ncbi:DUF2345 domain-containing protein [Microvirga puerhi]|uniref:DUF2345 domain-containing protein n=1 Tax=Microvirga puerhi TaxID=2876078 RepID=A0ABS7VSP2_9HYPH|nr:DUF2345 domain-containing protein [Microvirga puerhi]MBZ6078572.1 DUF2345 domain-containing protein [Microvirga puerhi]